MRLSPDDGCPDEAAKQMSKVRIGHLEHLGVPLHANHERVVGAFHRFDQTIRRHSRCDQSVSELLDPLMMHAVDRYPR